MGIAFENDFTHSPLNTLGKPQQTISADHAQSDALGDTISQTAIHRLGIASRHGQIVGADSHHSSSVTVSLFLNLVMRPESPGLPLPQPKCWRPGSSDESGLEPARHDVPVPVPVEQQQVRCGCRSDKYWAHYAPPT